MNSDNDLRPWITIFPDYPRAFAWIHHPCNESELDSYVGTCYGELYPGERRGVLGGEELPMWLTMRLCLWMDKWEEFDISDRKNDNEDDISDEERAIDDEGVVLARELKKLYGGKYRFRYSFAWRHGSKDWVVV